MAAPKVVHFATGNKKKLEEVRDGGAWSGCLHVALGGCLAASASRSASQCSLTHPALPPLPPQVVAILSAGQALPFQVDSVKVDLPELQVRAAVRMEGKGQARRRRRQQRRHQQRARGHTRPRPAAAGPAGCGA